jgi:hypothetical protein
MSEALRVRSIAMHLSSGSSLANAPASPSCWVVQTSEQLVLLAAFFLLRNRLQGLEGAGEASCLVLGVLRGGGSGAARVLEAFAVELAAARAELGRLADRGVVPGPRPSDAELLSLLGIDLEAVRRRTEETFGGMALGGRSGRRPGRDEVGWGGCRGRRCAIRRC